MTRSPLLLAITLPILVGGMQGCSCNTEPTFNDVACTSDGSTIALNSGTDRGKLIIVNRDRKSQRLIGPTGFYGGMQFSEDDKSLYCSFSEDGNKWRIMSINIRSAEHELLTTGNDFAPTTYGKSKILFWRSFGRSGDLFGGSNPSDLAVIEYDLLTGKERQLTEPRFFSSSSGLTVLKTKAHFTHDDLLYSLDLSSLALSSEEPADPTFMPLCSTSDAIVGSVLTDDPWLVQPASLRDGRISRLSEISQVSSAAYARSANVLIIGTIIPREVYVLKLADRSLTKVTVDWDE